MNDLNTNIKISFGKKIELARKATGYSRAKLAVELSVSSKTIQSWEMGRTFPENMALIPLIEKKLGFFIPDILGQTVREEMAKIQNASQKVVRKASTASSSTEETDRKEVETRE